mgnify:CR=1 FL=1
MPDTLTDYEQLQCSTHGIEEDREALLLWAQRRFGQPARAFSRTPTRYHSFDGRPLSRGEAVKYLLRSEERFHALCHPPRAAR